MVRLCVLFTAIMIPVPCIAIIRIFAVDQGTPVDAEIASSADRVLQVSPPAEPERVAPVSASRSGPVHALALGQHVHQETSDELVRVNAQQSGH